MKMFARAAILALVICVAFAGFAARAPKSAVFGSAHDFKSVGDFSPTGGASYTLCNFCHIAHKFGSAPTGPGYLLWNHTLSNVSSYGVYTSDSMSTTPNELGGQLTVSNLCLSCHDGTVAVNSWYEPQVDKTFQPIPQGTLFMNDDTTVRDLTKQHPINFVYPDAATAASIGLQPAADLRSVDGNGNVPLFAGRMQCATCHDPHAGPSAGVSLFFRSFPATPATTKTGSSCVYCHL